jgi:hypothetical protein
MSTTEERWFWPVDARLMHALRTDNSSTSLCGRWPLTDTGEIYPKDFTTARCATCQKKLDRPRPRKELKK